MLLGWLVSRRTRNARTEKEVANIYQSLYKGLNETVKNQNDQIANQQEQILDLQREALALQGEFSKLLHLVNQARVCRYWGSLCPIRRKLQDEERGERPITRETGQHAAPRFHQPQGDASEDAQKAPRGEGGDGDPDNEPP